MSHDHPYMAASGDDGTFEIKNMPAGKHEFQFWHETAGYLKNVKLKGGATDARGRAKLTIPAGQDARPGRHQGAGERVEVSSVSRTVVGGMRCDILYILTCSALFAVDRRDARRLRSAASILGPVANADAATTIRKALDGRQGRSRRAGRRLDRHRLGHAHAASSCTTATPPAMQPYNVTKEHEICTVDGKAPLQETLVVSPGSKGIKNVAVFLRDASRVHESAAAENRPRRVRPEGLRVSDARCRRDRRPDARHQEQRPDRPQHEHPRHRLQSIDPGGRLDPVQGAKGSAACRQRSLAAFIRG